MFVSIYFFLEYCLWEDCCSAEKLLTVIFPSLSGSHFLYFLSPASKLSLRKKRRLLAAKSKGFVVRVRDFWGIFFFFFFKDGCRWVGRIVVTVCLCVCVNGESRPQTLSLL